MHYDLVLAGGTVVEPSLGVHRCLDVGISDGKVVYLDEGIPSGSIGQLIALDGDLVTPGIIDLHTHVYWGGTPLGVPPDLVSEHHAVTTLVDAGSAGAGNIMGFKQYVAEPAYARVFAFLNIAFPGIIAAVYDPGSFVIVGENDGLRYDMVESAIDACRAFPELVRGVKVRASLEASGDQALEPVKLALEVARAVDRPLMVHINVPPPGRAEVLGLLCKGDILTHAFRGHPNAGVDRKGRVTPEMWEARERGVIMDLGHGGGSFSWDVTAQMLEQGFPPDVISSDIHLSCRFHPTWPGMPAFNMPNAMSKLLSLGMEIDEVIRAATVSPAAAIGQAGKLGTLEPGSVADVSVLRIEDGSFSYFDPFAGERKGTKRVVPRFAVVGGRLMTREGSATSSGEPDGSHGVRAW